MIFAMKIAKEAVMALKTNKQTFHSFLPLFQYQMKQLAQFTIFP